MVVIEHNLDVIKSADRIYRPRPRGRRGGRRDHRHRHARAGRRLADLLHRPLPARPGRGRGAGAEAAPREAQARAGRRLSRFRLGRCRGAGPVSEKVRAMGELAGWRTWWVKRRWYERNRRLRRRWRINRHMARAGAFIRYPVEGEVLEALDSGRLAIGEGDPARAGLLADARARGRDPDRRGLLSEPQHDAGRGRADRDRRPRDVRQRLLRRRRRPPLRRSRTCRSPGRGSCPAARCGSAPTSGSASTASSPAGSRSATGP